MASRQGLPDSGARATINVELDGQQHTSGAQATIEVEGEGQQRTKVEGTGNGSVAPPDTGGKSPRATPTPETTQ